jgi:hypothetical protein
MRELGFENFTIKELEVVDSNEQSVIDEREVYWMNVYSENFPMYNMKYFPCKCGGDTLSNHPNIVEIGKKISKKVSGGNNSQAVKIMMVDVASGEFEIFGSMSECQKKMNIPRHDIIGRRCRGTITKPYRNKYMFEYVI